MACDAGNGEAHYELASIYLLERSIPRDYLKAYALIKRANDKGYDKVRNLFIATDWRSRDVPFYSIMIDMLIAATENGIDDSSYLIGYRYDEGIVKERDGTLFRDFSKGLKRYLTASKKADEMCVNYS
jgi:TPR repeat protein